MSNPDLVQQGHDGGSYSLISLRDIFAAAALAGLLANPSPGEMGSAHMAAWAYDMANAMLAERAK